MPPSAVFREPLALNADGTMTSMAIEALPRLGTEHNVGDVPVVAWVYALGAMEPRPTTLKVRAPRERFFLLFSSFFSARASARAFARAPF